MSCRSWSGLWCHGGGKGTIVTVPAPRSTAVRAVLAGTAVLLLVPAARADSGRGWSLWLTGLDLAVACCLVVLGWRQPRMWASIWTLAAAALWSLGSLHPSLVGLHRGALVVALASPLLVRSVPHRTARIVATTIVAIVLASSQVSAVAAGVLLFVLAAVLVARARWSEQRLLDAMPLVVLGTAEVLVGFLGTLALPGSRTLLSTVYAVGVLSSVAMSVTVHVGRRRHLVDAVPASADLVAHDPHELLTALLRDALGTDALTVRRPTSGIGRAVQVDGTDWAVVLDDDRVLDDEATWLAVSAAVALVGQHVTLLGHSRRRADELAGSRRRLLDAADRERALVGPLLRASVTSPLRQAAEGLGPDDGVVARELRGAASAVDDLVVGLAPIPLGSGRLVQALQELAARSPVRVEVRVGAGVSAGQQAEATAYAVCAESAVNAWKHSHAEQVIVDVWVDDALLHVTVRDDGVGGADPQGSGLVGLADRVATLRGRFCVISEPGVGTLVSASLLRVTRS